MGIVLTKLVQRIREEFEEAPGLRLTIREGARFWGLDEQTCEQVLSRLCASGVLWRGTDERYRLASGR
jgi:predicted transcriptional regulator of viral defense system